MQNPNWILFSVAVFMMLVLSSCSTSEPPKNLEQYHISINYQDFPDPINLSDVLESFRMVPLETSDEVIVGRISQIDMVNDLIFVRMFEKSYGIYVFDNKGIFQREIGHFGNGPGEHTGLVSFSFNQDLTHIYLTAAGQRKIIEYSLEGQWIRDIRIDHQLSDIHFFSDTTYVSANWSEHWVKLGNLSSGVRLDTLRRNTGELRIGGQLFYPFFNGGILFSTPHLDTVYYINEYVVSPRFIFDFPKNMIWLEGPYFENENLFYFGCRYENKTGEYKGRSTRKYFIFDKESGSLSNLASDDIMLSAAHGFYNMTKSGEFVSYIDPVYLLDKKDQILSNSEYDYPEGFYEKLEAIQEGDNPILLFSKLKDKISPTK